METVEVVVKIPKDSFEFWQKVKQTKEVRIGYWETAISNGILLPKNHGRLIDADKIESNLHNKAFDLAGSKRFYEINWAHKMVCDAPTIIEADKEVENDD